MSDRFRVSRPFGIFYRMDNTRDVAGHARLFNRDGWPVYYYAEQAPGWALHRRWNFGFFCVHHVGPGKATDPEGWHITFARLRVQREYQGFSVRWQWADTSRTRPIR